MLGCEPDDLMKEMNRSAESLQALADDSHIDSMMEAAPSADPMPEVRETVLPASRGEERPAAAPPVSPEPSPADDPKGFVFNIVLSVLILMAANVCGWLAVYGLCTGDVLLGILVALLCVVLVINGVMLLEKRRAGVILMKVRYYLMEALFTVGAIAGIITHDEEMYLILFGFVIVLTGWMLITGYYYRRRWALLR